MNQNSRIILNLNSEERPQSSYIFFPKTSFNSNRKPPRNSLEKYPSSSSKVTQPHQKTSYFTKTLPKTDILQTKKNMKQILKQASYYADSNSQPARNSAQSNKIEISTNIRVSKGEQDPAYYPDFNRTLYMNNNNLGAKLTNQTKFYEYKPNKALKNDSVTCFNPANFTTTNIEPAVVPQKRESKKNFLVEANYLNSNNNLNRNSGNNNNSNKTELGPPKYKNPLNLNMRIIGTGNKNENHHNQQIFYSPPNYTKRQEQNSRNFEIEDSLNREANEEATKPNAININMIQNKLMMAKRDSENEIFKANKIQSQQNSPYLLTENSKKNKESNNIREPKIEQKSSENRSNSKSAIQSFKDFSENFMKKTKNLFTFENKTNRRTKCHCDSSLLDNVASCTRALEWIQYNYKQTDFENLKKDYERMQKAEPDEKCVSQIEKDLPRTFPSYPYFEKDNEGNNCLRRILVTFSKYDPQLGYVQGMNFIAGNLLFHAEEYLAFWLLVMLFEVFELRDIYMPKLPGLSKHCQILDILILTYMPDLYAKMAENSVAVNMFFSPWIFSLFGVLLPVEQMSDFLDNLLKGKWPFAYKFVFVILKTLRAKLLEEDTVGMLTFLTENNYKNGNQQVEKLNWKNCIKEANKVTLENGFINKMLDSFDQDHQRFRCIK